MFNSKGIVNPGMQAYRAPSLFQPHRARQAIRDAHEGKIKPIMGFYFGLSSVPLAKFVAPMGYDFAWIDWEHTSCNVETMNEMVQAVSFMSEGKTMPFVRIPGHDHAAVGYALDAGASIVVPQVETVEQAQHVISAAKFGTHNKGTRSAPPFRYIPGLSDTQIDGSRSFWKNLNDQAAIMIQIETLQGIQNLDEILTKCPEVDVVWLGTLDCRISMNMEFNAFGPDSGEEWLAATKLYAETCAKHNKPTAGFAFGTVDMMQGMGRGMSMVMVAADVLGIIGQSDSLAQARDCMPSLKNSAIAAPGVTANGTANGMANGSANGHANGHAIESKRKSQQLHTAVVQETMHSPVQD